MHGYKSHSIQNSRKDHEMKIEIKPWMIVTVIVLFLLVFAYDTLSVLVLNMWHSHVLQAGIVDQ
jgi:heme/copper-type cytochrome/quinol oxidase subunit 2